MKAAIICHPGGPENFFLEARPMLVLKEGHVLIRV
jgi:hypothetical protein